MRTIRQSQQNIRNSIEITGERLYVFAILESQVKIESADTTENWLFAIDNVTEIR